MTSPASTPLRVSLSFGPNATTDVGRLAFDRTRGAAVLEYAPAFVASRFALNPRWPIPSNTLVWAAEPRTFEGLHGVFADSLPDAWGRELMRRRAIGLGIDPASLTVFDQLAIVGRRGMGALEYEPAFVVEDASAALDLDALSHAALEVLAGEQSDLLKTLERLGDSSGGARPKILVAMNDDGDMSPDLTLPSGGYRPWIVKFRTARDRIDAGALEAAYADMARAAGVMVAPTRLLQSSRGDAGYFATERFDRGDAGARLHMLSVAAMLETRWDAPTIDYNGLMSLTRLVTRDEADVEQMFRRMLFNVLAENRDDHSKQHAFLMDRDGAWRLAPAYDLTFSSGPGGEHYLAVGSRGSNIAPDDVRYVSDRQGFRPASVAGIVDDVRAAVAHFRRFGAEYDVSKASLNEIGAVLDRHVAEFA